MRSRLAKILLLLLCTLPALGFDARTPDRGVVASFYFACPEYRIPARVRAKAYTKEQLPSRTAYWLIREFEPDMPPKRAYKVVGEVEVLARGHSTTLGDLHQKAKEAAEKMGGDALVDVAWRDAGATKPKIGERGNYVLTAKVARWEQGGTSALVGQ
jgi:hypothetical protein